MNRFDIIQSIINKTGAATYLEIGVNRGQVISKLACRNKIGVDPRFRFSPRLKLKRWTGAVRFKAFQTTSDDFFAKHAPAELGAGVDVVFVDGLHTYTQALRDVESSLRYLSKAGVIVMHDCNPLNAAGAYPVKHAIDEVLSAAAKGEVPGWNNHWNGDIWKAVAYLRSTRSDLNVFTLDLDWGLGIVAHGKPEGMLSFSLGEIQSADYAMLEKDRQHILNLKPPRYLDAWLKNRG